MNAVAPGFIVTEQSARSRTDPNHVKAVTEQTPMKRWGQPEDISGTVPFLASPASAFMTGACLPVDGGYCVTIKTEAGTAAGARCRRGDLAVLGATVVRREFMGRDRIETLAQHGVAIERAAGSSAGRGAERAETAGAPGLSGSRDDPPTDRKTAVAPVTVPNHARDNQENWNSAAGRSRT